MTDPFFESPKFNLAESQSKSVIDGQFKHLMLSSAKLLPSYPTFTDIFGNQAYR